MPSSNPRRAPYQQPLNLGPRSHFDLLHGGHDNNVTICTLSHLQKKWREKSHTHETVAGLLGDLVDEYAEDRDLYLSQNGFYKWRNTRNVAAITSCYVDLDTYKIPALSGLKPEQILDQAMRAFPWLPVPTMLASSGRGVYFVWVFKKPLQKNDLPRWAMVEAGLVGLLKGLGADPAAKDVTRVLRVAGSAHMKTGNVVYYRHIADPVAFFRLETLVREHCVPEPLKFKQPEKSSTIEFVKTPGVAPKKPAKVTRLWNGYTLAHGRMQDLEYLASARGPLTDYRSRFLYVLSVAAAWYCPTPEALVRELDAFAQQHFVDPHRYCGSEQCKTVIERVSAFKRGLKVVWQGEEIDPRYRIQHRTIIRLLDIAPAEQQNLQVILSQDEKDRRYRLRRPLTREQYLREKALERDRKRLEALDLLDQGHTVTSAARHLGVTRKTFYSRCV